MSGYTLSWERRIGGLPLPARFQIQRIQGAKFAGAVPGDSGDSIRRPCTLAAWKMPDLLLYGLLDATYDRL